MIILAKIAFIIFCLCALLGTIRFIAGIAYLADLKRRAAADGNMFAGIYRLAYEQAVDGVAQGLVNPLIYGIASGLIALLAWWMA